MRKPLNRSRGANERRSKGLHGATAPNRTPASRSTDLRRNTGDHTETFVSGAKGAKGATSPATLADSKSRGKCSSNVRQSSQKDGSVVRPPRPHQPLSVQIKLSDGSADGHHDKSTKLERKLRELGVWRIKTDDGRQMYLFERRGKFFIKSYAEICAQGGDLFAEISAKLNIDIFNTAAKKIVRDKIETAILDKKIVAVTRHGYDRRKGFERRPLYYALGNGRVISPVGTTRFIPALDLDDLFEARGSLVEWEDGVSKVLRDQAGPLLILAFGLTPILQHFSKAAGFLVTNAIMNVNGPTTSFKSNLTNLVTGSIWGGGLEGDLGFAESWNGTVNAIEMRFASRNNCLLALDEATAAGNTPQARAEAFLNTAHRLSLGVTKRRLGQDVLRFETMVLTNSNDNPRDGLAESEDVRRAFDVRVISFNVPARKTGLFDTIPAGFNGVDEAMVSLRDICASRHYGHLGPALIEGVLGSVHRDEAAFLESLKKHMSTFLKKAGVTSALGSHQGFEERRAKPFALSFAALMITFELGVLDRSKWGNVRKTLLRAWRKYGRRQIALSPTERLQAYLSRRDLKFIDATEKQPTVSDLELDASDGVKFHRQQFGPSLAMTPASVKRNLGFTEWDLRVLRSKGLIKCTKGLQDKVRIRMADGEVKRDRLYVFALKSFPR
jgi:hypothetical protein